MIIMGKMNYFAAPVNSNILKHSQLTTGQTLHFLMDTVIIAYDNSVLYGGKEKK
jgi:hypothetical protein